MLKYLKKIRWVFHLAALRIQTHISSGNSLKNVFMNIADGNAEMVEGANFIIFSLSISSYFVNFWA